MRVSPILTNLTRFMLVNESKIKSRPVLFLIHPNELINEDVEIESVNRRAKNYISYLLGDKLRYHLKLKNLGTKALPLFEKQLDYLQKNKFSFVTVADYYKLTKKVNSETIS